MPNETPRRRRRLAAILMADVVGYSKMMGRDEERTTELILEFHELVREGIERHGGRVVGTAGDSVFGDFDSIVEAMELATEMQQSLHERNAKVVVEDQIVARIGLHLGDVIVEGDDVFGEGINIAARLEQIAAPGGIMLSEAVHQQVKQHSTLPFQDLGPRTLKNIDQQVRVFSLGPEVFGGIAVSEESSLPKRGERNLRIREAVELIADRIGERADSAAAIDSIDGGVRLIDVDDTDDSSAVGTATIPVLGLGVLGILAWSTGWSSNAWYPFIGAWLLGIALGGVLRRLTRRPWVAGFLHAVGIGVGAAFFDNVVTRSIFWVLALTILGPAVGKAVSSRDRRSTR